MIIGLCIALWFIGGAAILAFLTTLEMGELTAADLGTSLLFSFAWPIIAIVILISLGDDVVLWGSKKK